MRSKTVAPIFPRNMGRLHLNLPQFSARLHNKIVRIAVAPGLCHSESQLGRFARNFASAISPRRFPVTDRVARAPSPAFAQTAPISATASKSPITTPVLMILRSLCPKANQLHAIPSRFAASLPQKKPGNPPGAPPLSRFLRRSGVVPDTKPLRTIPSEGASSAVSAHTTMIPNPKSEVNQNPSCY